jgi:hypothetical protein
VRVAVKRPEESTPAWTDMWVAWIAAFFLIEGTALYRRKQADTLSWHVWVWFGIPHHSVPARGVRVKRISLLGFLAWLSAHFLSGDEV